MSTGAIDNSGAAAPIETGDGAPPNAETADLSASGTQPAAGDTPPVEGGEVPPNVDTAPIGGSDPADPGAGGDIEGGSGDDGDLASLLSDIQDLGAAFSEADTGQDPELTRLATNLSGINPQDPNAEVTVLHDFPALVEQAFGAPEFTQSSDSAATDNGSSSVASSESSEEASSGKQPGSVAEDGQPTSVATAARPRQSVQAYQKTLAALEKARQLASTQQDPAAARRILPLIQKLQDELSARSNKYGANYKPAADTGQEGMSPRKLLAAMRRLANTLIPNRTDSATSTGETGKKDETRTHEKKALARTSEKTGSDQKSAETQAAKDARVAKQASDPHARVLQNADHIAKAALQVYGASENPDDEPLDRDEDAASEPHLASDSGTIALFSSRPMGIDPNDSAVQKGEQVRRGAEYCGWMLNGSVYALREKAGQVEDDTGFTADEVSDLMWAHAVAESDPREGVAPSAEGYAALMRNQVPQQVSFAPDSDDYLLQFRGHGEVANRVNLSQTVGQDVNFIGDRLEQPV